MELKELDPLLDFDQENPSTSLNSKLNKMAHIDIGIDLTRSSEILFSPYLAGYKNQGISETVLSIL